MERLDYDAIYTERFGKYYDELKWLYCELYENRMDCFEELCAQLRTWYQERSTLQKELDRARVEHPLWYKSEQMLGMMLDVNAFAKNLNGVREKLDYIDECGVNFLYLMSLWNSSKRENDDGNTAVDIRKINPELGTIEDLAQLCADCHSREISICLDFVMDQTSEESRSDPTGLNEMICNMLFLANQGIDMIFVKLMSGSPERPDRNRQDFPQANNIARIMRIVCEIVCPGVLILGEVMMEPDKIIPYLGTAGKPGYHMLYNVTMMASIWHTVATRDVRLLRKQIDTMNSLPRQYVLLNYLRCQDAIDWNLDYAWLRDLGMEEIPHKKFLNDFLTGRYPGSFARAELYASDSTSGDTCLCGTTASLCGIERFTRERNGEALEKAVCYHLTLHAFILTQSGIPVLYSGDEIGQENDYTYHNVADKREDERNLHRGAFRWDNAEKRAQPESVQAQIFNGLKKQEEIRKNHSVFRVETDMRTIDTWDDAVLGVVRENAEERLIALFNFCGSDNTAWIREDDELYEDLLTGEMYSGSNVPMNAYGVRWLWRSK